MKTAMSRMVLVCHPTIPKSTVKQMLVPFVTGQGFYTVPDQCTLTGVKRSKPT